MELHIVCSSNEDCPYINTAHVTLENGEQITIDRYTTEYDFYPETGILDMVWCQLYVWDDEGEHPVPEDLFDGEYKFELEIEDDAPKGYICECLSHEVWK